MDGSNMPQATASYTQAEAQAWTEGVELDLNALHDVIDQAMALRPLDNRLKAINAAANKLHNRLRDLADDATARLSPTVNTPLYSGGTGKPRRAES